MKHRAEWVTWVDSAGQSGWLTADQIHSEPLVCQTLGFVVKDAKTTLVLALNHSSDPNSARPYGECIAIPKGCIVKRKKVRA